MQQTIESCGMQQHIDQATHYLKHRYRVQCTAVSKERNNAKAKYYSTKIKEYSRNPKMLYKLTDALTVNKQGQQLPCNIDDSQLSNNFYEFFEEKIITYSPKP